jgi:hypothetical protein
MSASAHSARLARGRLDAEALRVGLTALALTSAGLAVFMAVAPHAFYKSLGPFGVANSHYIRDTASFYAAFAFAQAIAVRRASWRVPVLAATAVQYGLHSINHLVDIANAHPMWIGYVDFAALAGTTLLLIAMLRAASFHEAAPAGRRPGT